jgi:uncharacterized protein (DUF1501 family)
MERRQFLKSLLSSSAAASFATAWAHSRALASHGGRTGLDVTVADWPHPDAFAGLVTVPVPRTIVNFMLLGGADLRYLFAPPKPVDAPAQPDVDYSEAYFEARKLVYRLDSLGNPAVNGAGESLYSTYSDLFDDQYLHTTDPVSGKVFGIHRSAPWLKSEFDLGNVAIVCNAFLSVNRRHDHSQLMVQTGDPLAERLVTDRNGWAGRLVEHMGTDSTVVAVSSNVPVFAHGTNPSNRLSQTIHARDTRNFALPGPSSPTSKNERSVLARALESYYANRSVEIDIEKPADWPYRRFYQHELAIRALGDALVARLTAISPDPTNPNRPDSIRTLYESNVAGGGLYRTSLGRQIGNIYDTILARDILGARVIYGDYGAWDNHANEQATIERNLHDFYSTDGALAVLKSELAQAEIDGHVSNANNNIIIHTKTDFGRQIRGNGTWGTDHGEGFYDIYIGDPINAAGGGRVLGEMFPQLEITGTPSPYEKVGSDVMGQTSIERTLGALCDWIHPGSGSVVFPGILDPTTPLEAPLAQTDLDGLFV